MRFILLSEGFENRSVVHDINHDIYPETTCDSPMWAKGFVIYETTM